MTNKCETDSYHDSQPNKTSIMKKLYLLLFPLLLHACGHDGNGMEPEPVPEPTPVEPTTEVNPFDPVDVEGAPMKVMRLKKEDFLKLFVGKEWMANRMLGMDKKGNFQNYLYVGGGTLNLIVESDSIFYMWGDDGAGGIYTVKQHYFYDEEMGRLVYPVDNPNWGFDIALINEECLLMYRKNSKGDFDFYTLPNKDKTAVHQPEYRKGESIFPFKTDCLDKDAFTGEVLSNFLWSPVITYGVYDDGTVTLTDTALKSTGLYFAPDGVMREFFKDEKTNLRSVHKCPYTFDKETGTLAFAEGRSPSIFRAFDNKVLAISSFKAYEHYSMIGLVVDTNGKSKFSKIVYILEGLNLSYALDYDQRAVEVDFDE